MKTVTEPYDICLLINDVADEFRLMHAGRDFRVEGENRLLITGDGDKIRQVVYNLLSNVVKFCGAHCHYPHRKETGGCGHRLHRRSRKGCTKRKL